MSVPFRVRGRFLVAALFSTLFLAAPIPDFAAAQATAPQQTIAEKIAASKDLLDINTATPAQLKALPGMGDAYVQRVHRGLAAKTARMYTQKLAAFARYLDHADIRRLDGITPRNVREFYENTADGAPRRSYGSTLRVFFRWAS